MFSVQVKVAGDWREVKIRHTRSGAKVLADQLRVNGHKVRVVRER